MSSGIPVKIFTWGSVATTTVCAILLIAIAATPSYYHQKIGGGYEQQLGAWQTCMKATSVGSSHATLSHRMSTFARRMSPQQSCSSCSNFPSPYDQQCYAQCNAAIGGGGGSSVSGGGGSGSSSGSTCSSCSSFPSPYDQQCYAQCNAASGGGGGAGGLYGTGCSTIDVSNSQNTDFKNQVQSVRGFLVLGILLSFAVIVLPIVAHFVPSQGGLLCMLAGGISIISGVCLLISWAIVAGKKPDGMDLFWGFALQVVITVVFWVIGALLLLAGINMKGSQVTKTMAKHQDTQANKQDTHNQLAASWQATQKPAPQQAQPQYGQQPQYGYAPQQQAAPQYNPQYAQPQQTGYGYAPQPTQEQQPYGQTPITPNPVYNQNQSY